MEKFIDLMGWIGAIEVLMAYFLISTNRITANSTMYQFLNAKGAIFLIVNTIALKAYPSAFVNVIWTGVALYSLIKSKINKVVKPD